MRYFLLFCVLVIALFLSLSLGRYDISLEEIVRLILFKIGFLDSLQDLKNAEFILFENRLPRAFFALFVGAGLGVAGASFQAMFKNALASPDILGVTSGAAFGTILALMFGLNIYFVSFSSFVFGILSLIITLFIAKGVKNHIMGNTCWNYCFSTFPKLYFFSEISRRPSRCLARYYILAFRFFAGR